MKSLISVVLIALLAAQGNAQLSEGGLPWSMRHGLDRSAVPTARAIVIDPVAVAAEDARRAESGAVPADARMLAVDADLSTSGVWHALPNGDGIWRLRVESPGALATELFFRDFYLPLGGILHVYSKDGEEILGGFSGYHNKHNGIFATAQVQGDACFVEYFEPAAVRAEGRFVISSLGHTYRHLGGDRAANCHVDVNCAQEGNGWQDQRDGVVKLRLTMNGVLYECSGGLVNNVTLDCSRYFLTAYHCGQDPDLNVISDADLLLTKFYFNYERTGCGLGSASTGHNITGAVRRAESNDDGGANGSDFLLLEAEDAVNDSWAPYWLGWDAASGQHTGGKCIHHPQGDEKKISTFTAPTLTTSWNFSGLQSHYLVYWVSTANGWGVTAGGSSGSPLFDASGKVIGTLTGGSSFCESQQPGGQELPDVFGKMSYHWSSNPGPATEELRTWLDPQNTGTLVLEGSYGPCGTIGVQESASLDRPLLAPNPASDALRITFPTTAGPINRVNVSDITGKVVASTRPTATENMVLAVGHLSAGTYFVWLSTDGASLPAVKFEVVPR